MESHFEFIFKGLSSSEQELLIAKLAEAGFEGFEERAGQLLAYITSAGLGKIHLAELALPYHTYSELQPKNWNEQWEQSFEPVLVGSFCSIRASFHKPVPGVKHDLIITPKMSFGTGHHATTYQVIDMMRELDIAGKEVLDFGTGTGVLAILSKRMGASRIVAIDNDPWSIDNARENFEMNECRDIELVEGAGLTMQQEFDIVLANINKNVILQHFLSMKQHLKPGGVLILSGLLQGDEDIVLNEANKIGLAFDRITERDNWIALKLKHLDAF